MTEISIPERTITVNIPGFSVTIPPFKIVLPDEEEPLRGVRGQASSCSTASKCDILLDCLRAAGVNAYFYPVWYYGWYYHTSLDTHRDFDSLAYLIPMARQRGIQVYPLIIAAYVPLASHPEWNAKDKVGQNWLDFTIPGARTFVADVAEEIATNYDVDGILLDYIRWPSEDVLPGEAIAKTVHQISQVTRNVELGAAVLADPNYAPHLGQNWVQWLTDGDLDFVNPMAYYNNAILRSLLQAWDNTGFFPQCIIPRLSTCVFKPAFKVKPVEDVLRQIDMCYDAGATGMTLWDDRYICNNPDLITALGGGRW